jgi:hypothetical protein
MVQGHTGTGSVSGRTTTPGTIRSLSRVRIGNPSARRCRTVSSSPSACGCGGLGCTERRQQTLRGHLRFLARISTPEVRRKGLASGSALVRP